jgi:hypothetical protein
MKGTAFAVVLAGLAAATSAHASGPEAGKLSFSLFGGTDIPTSGDVHGGATAPVPDLGPLNPDLAGVSAELRIQPRSHDRIYDRADSYGLELGYGLSDRSEVFGQIRHTRASQGNVQVGGAFVPALNTELPVYGNFSTYKSYSAELGYRHYFMEPGSVRPFVAGRLGATRTDAIKASFDIPAAAISIPNARFTEQSWSASAGVDVGVLFPVSDNFSITAQAGLRYIAKLDGDDRDIGGLGLSSINDDAKRLSVPVSISARWDF